LSVQAVLASLASSAAATAAALQWAGSYLVSEKLAVAALNRTQPLGSDHEATSALRFHRARARHSLGRYAVAETEYREVLNGQLRMLGSDHPDTLNTGRALQELKAIKRDEQSQ
jgi:hypothetical protein